MWPAPDCHTHTHTHTHKNREKGSIKLYGYMLVATVFFYTGYHRLIFKSILEGILIKKKNNLKTMIQQKM